MVKRITRREALQTAGALVGASLLSPIGPLLPVKPPTVVVQSAPSGRPLRLGFQVHRTGIGSVYGTWFERVANAAVKYLNDTGGIAGRPVELVPEDDGTDPQRGVEVVEKLAQQHKVDFIFGTLFSNVVIAAAPRAGELKIPYLVVSEGYHVASGKLNRYVFQPGITDVRAQLTALAPWIVRNLGKRIAMIFPDYAFGYDHRDFFTASVRRLGGAVPILLPIPPTEVSFTKYFSRIPQNVDVIYHVMVGPGVLTFLVQLGEFFGSRRPQLFGFIDSLEGVNIASPGLDFLEGSFIWEAFPRYADGYPTRYEAFYRSRVGCDASGAAREDPKSVSTYSHMFGVWETLFVIKETIEQSGYQNPTPMDYRSFIETLERSEWFNEGNWHPQGPKRFAGAIHQAFGQQFVSQVEGKRLKVVFRTKIDDGMYKPEADYTTQPL